MMAYKLESYRFGKWKDRGSYPSVLEAQAHAPYGRHHALCDARALRLAYRAAVHPRRPVATALSASQPAG